MGIDKKSLIRAAILSAILGLNGVTAMGIEDRPRGESRWDINNPQNDHTTEMIEMDELAECIICFKSKKECNLLKTYCCGQHICKECVKAIDEMARLGEGHRTKNRCPHCRDASFKKWGKLVREVVPTEEGENTNLTISEEEKAKIAKMDPETRQAVIKSLKDAGKALSEQAFLQEQIKEQMEKKGYVDEELKKKIKLQQEIAKNNRDAVAWDLANASAGVTSDKVSDSNSYDQKSSDFADKYALEQAISRAKRDKEIEEAQYGTDITKLGDDIEKMERALGILNRKDTNEKVNEDVVATANNNQSNDNNNEVQACLEMFHQQQMAQQQAYQPQMYQPQMYQPQMYQPQMYQPQMYQPQMYQPQQWGYVYA